METLIGFVVGYYVGTREGRAGFAKMRSSLDAIRQSEELRQLAVMAAPMIKRLASGGAGAVVSDVLDELNRRATNSLDSRAA